MNVLFATSWYPSKLHPTLGNFVERHAHAVQFADNELRLVHLAFSNRIFLPHLSEKEVHGIQVLHVFIPRVFTKISFIKRLMYKRVTKRLAQWGFEPEILHGHVFYPVGEMASYIANALNIPLVFTEHWNGYKPIMKAHFTPHVRAVTSRAVSDCKRIMPVSDELGHRMQKLGFKGAYETVNNAVDHRLFYPMAHTGRNHVIFVHISNFAKQAKNPEGIIEAFSHVQHPAARLIIAGDGDLDRIKKFVSKENIDDSKVEFFGTMAYEEVAALMRRCDCHVLFSNFENLPCVIAEAHCCGLPVISTDVGGIPEMVDVENGILIKPNDISALTDAFEYMAENIQAYNKNLISAKAMARYSFHSIGKHFKQIYTKVIAGE